MQVPAGTVSNSGVDYAGSTLSLRYEGAGRLEGNVTAANRTFESFLTYKSVGGYPSWTDQPRTEMFRS